MTPQTKLTLFDRRETVAESLIKDGVTFAGLLLCIWFSQAMGGGVWEFITVVMFTFFALNCMPWERASRTTVLHSKAEALAWAESLPDDDTAAPSPQAQPTAPPAE
jgi:hypothetical protein